MSSNIARSKSRSSKTKRGHFALEAISRFSTDIATGVRNRYTGNKGLTNVMSDVSRLMSIINTEDKNVPTLNTALTVTASSPQIIYIPGPAQGAASNQRNGDSIKINRIDLELTFQYSGAAATATNGSQKYRYWLVRYLKTPATSGSSNFNLSEFLTVDVNGNYTPMSLMNTDTNENFQIMTTGECEVKIFTLATAQLTYSLHETYRHECSFHQEYNGSLATNVCDNAVFMVFTALFAANTGGTSTVNLNSRLWYIDN
jgi:hypothetical protein